MQPGTGNGPLASTAQVADSARQIYTIYLIIHISTKRGINYAARKYLNPNPFASLVPD